MGWTARRAESARLGTTPFCNWFVPRCGRRCPARAPASDCQRGGRGLNWEVVPPSPPPPRSETVDRDRDQLTTLRTVTGDAQADCDQFVRPPSRRSDLTHGRPATVSGTRRGALACTYCQLRANDVLRGRARSCIRDPEELATAPPQAPRGHATAPSLWRTGRREDCRIRRCPGQLTVQLVQSLAIVRSFRLYALGA